jgi:hypothetical protein
LLQLQLATPAGCIAATLDANMALQPAKYHVLLLFPVLQSLLPCLLQLQLAIPAGCIAVTLDAEMAMQPASL